MVYSYNANEQTLATNDPMVYTIDVVKTGTAVIHNLDTSVFTLNRTGYYYITVTATGAASDTSTEPISIALYNGSTAIPGAVASALSSDATDVATLMINIIIPVRPSCCAVDNTVNLTVVNTGVDAIYSNSTITIARVS